MLELNNRARKILAAITQEYLATGEAVGSRTVTRRYGVDLSPATVRNVMSDLEEMGYIRQPHASAGRVPTDLGLRFFVDSLLKVRQLSPKEREELANRYAFSSREADVALREAGKVLSELSSHTVVLMTPRVDVDVLKHIEFVRIGTKIPAVLPMRITRDLVKMLRKHHPLWMSVHFTHPTEITPETREAAARLADAGIPLGSQTVLLKDINDDAAVMRELMHGLLTMRIKPYYLYQCDPIKGSGHFRTPVHKGIEIIQSLRGHTTGYACPMFVVDAPGGGGKILLAPDAIAGREGDDLLLRNFEGKIYRYPDPGGKLGRDRTLKAVAAQ